MASKVSNLESKKHHRSVNVIVDPRTCDLDKTIRDILQISELVSNEMPSAQMQSIAVKGYFAVVKVVDLTKDGFNGATIRLYYINGAWKMRKSRPYTVNDKQNSKNKPKIII